MRLLLPLSIVFVLAACEGGTGSWDECDVFDDDCEAGSLELERVQWECNGNDVNPDRPLEGVWDYQVVLRGWAGWVDLTIADTGDALGIEEYHPMNNVDYTDTDDIWGLHLPTAPPPHSEGQNTGFRCGVHDETNLTWMISIGDEGTGDELFCGVWGHDAGHFSVHGCDAVTPTR